MNKILKILVITFISLSALFYFRDYILILAIKIFYQKNYHGEKLPLPRIDIAQLTELSDYVKNKYRTPEEYVVSKFMDHDIIFIGERHRIKHDAELIQSLIPVLYENGIYNLGMEFAIYKDQLLIDSLLSAKEYSQETANTILFNWSELWGYQEYTDIFKSAWQLNRSVPGEKRKFRIVGLNIPQNTGNDDDVMTKVIMKEFMNRNEKALIYCGMHHAFTAYKYPILENGKFSHFFDHRVGNMVYKQIGDRAITICFHYPWGTSDGSNYPIDGIIDTLMKTIPKEYQRAGFDTRSTPFGDLPATNTIYRYGYDKFTLKDFCDGYIFQKPLSQYQGVTTIKNFINRKNIKEARKRFSNYSFKFIFDNFGTVFWNYAISMDADLRGEFPKYK